MANWTTYRDRGGYSIEVPADWEMDRYIVPATQAVVGATTVTSFETRWGGVYITHIRAGTGYFTWDSFGSYVAERVAALESDTEVDWVNMLEIDDSHYRVEYLRKPPGYCDTLGFRRYVAYGPYYGGAAAIVEIEVCAAWYEAPFVERILGSFTY